MHASILLPIFVLRITLKIPAMKRLFTLIAVALVATTNICSAQVGLNEIRFRDWEDKDWLDNDYIRELRSYIDAYGRGEVENSALDAYADIIDSQFVVAYIEPALFGGAYLLVVFLDDPSKVFHSHVYSFVDEEREVVVGYEVRWLDLCDAELDLTREDIFQIAADHPDDKVLW